MKILPSPLAPVNPKTMRMQSQPERADYFVHAPAALANAAPQNIVSEETPLQSKDHARALDALRAGRLSAARAISNFPNSAAIACVALARDACALELLPVTMVHYLGLAAAKSSHSVSTEMLATAQTWPLDVTADTVRERLHMNPRCIETVPSRLADDRAFILQAARVDPRFLSFYNGAALDDPYFVAALIAAHPEARVHLRHAVAPNSDEGIGNDFLDALFTHAAVAEQPLFFALRRCVKLDTLPDELIDSIQGHLDTESAVALLKAVYNTSTPATQDSILSACAATLGLSLRGNHREWVGYLSELRATYIGSGLNVLSAAEHDRALVGLLLGKFEPNRAIESYPNNEKVVRLASSLGGDLKYAGRALRASPAILIPLLETQQIRMRDVPAQARDIEAVMLAAIVAKPENFFLASDRLRQERALIIAALKHPACGVALMVKIISGLAESSKHDPELAFWRAFADLDCTDLPAHVKKTPLMQFMLSRTQDVAEHSDSEEVMRQAVTRRGSLLEYASDGQKANPKVAVPALEQSLDAWEFIADVLQRDPNVAVRAMGRAGQPFEALHPSVRDLKPVALPAVRFDATLAQLLGAELRADADIALAVAHQDPMQLEFIDEVCRDNRDVALAAAAKNKRALRFLAPRWERDPDVMRLMIRDEPDMLRRLPVEVRRDRAVLLTLSPLRMQYVDKSLYQDPMLLTVAARRASGWESMRLLAQAVTPLQRSLAFTMLRHDGGILSEMPEPLRASPAAQALAAETALTMQTFGGDAHTDWMRALSMVAIGIFDGIPDELAVDRAFTLAALRVKPFYITELPSVLAMDATFMRQATLHEPRCAEYVGLPPR